MSISVKLADALRLAGEHALSRGVIEEARSYSVDSPVWEAKLLRSTARLYLSQQRVDRAISTMQQAIGIAIPIGDRDLLTRFYLDMSSMYMRQGDGQQAMKELTEGLDLVTLGEGADARTGPSHLWRLLLRLAQLHSGVGDDEIALRLALSALSHARRVRSSIGHARVQGMLAFQYDQMGEPNIADEYRRMAMREMRKLGDNRGADELLRDRLAPTSNLGPLDAWLTVDDDTR